MARRKPSPADRSRMVADLAARIDADLDALTADAVATLRDVSVLVVPAGARQLMFEAFELGPCLDVCYRVLGDEGFLSQLAYGPVFEQVPLASVLRFTDAEWYVAVEECLAREAVFRRFPAWWLAAGGEAYPLPASLGEHDSTQSLPLAWAG